MATVVEGNHDTVIVHSSTGGIVHRFEGPVPFRQALTQYAEMIGIDEADKYIKAGPFGFRMSTPEGDFRATYRRS